MLRPGKEHRMSLRLTRPSFSRSPPTERSLQRSPLCLAELTNEHPRRSGSGKPSPGFCGRHSHHSFIPSRHSRQPGRFCVNPTHFISLPEGCTVLYTMMHQMLLPMPHALEILLFMFRPRSTGISGESLEETVGCHAYHGG